jgi:hypothetical protein
VKVFRIKMGSLLSSPKIITAIIIMPEVMKMGDFMHVCLIWRTIHKRLPESQLLRTGKQEDFGERPVLAKS